MILFVANLGRRLTEWAERHGERRDRSLIDLMKDAWGLR